MKHISYSIVSLSKAGYSIVDNQISVNGNAVTGCKVCAMIKDQDGNIYPAYLQGDHAKKVDIKAPEAFPKDWYIIHAVSEGKPNDKPSYFFLTIKNTQKTKTVSQKLPIVIGDNICCKSFKGVFQVVYVSFDTIVITSKTWAQEYIDEKRVAPVHTIFWDDYKHKYDLKQSYA